ncbi:ABC transporter substrate-binding protein [Blastococcus sp. SYSU DS0533]
MRARTTRAAAASAVLAVTLSACSTEARDSAGSEAGEDGVAMGVGVTEDTIRLATLSDMSGVFATAGVSLAHAQQVYFDHLNEQGGICSRQIELEILDTGYDVQRTVTQYAQVRNEVLGFPAIIGGPMNVALFDRFESDDVLAIPVSWSSALLESEHMMLTGPAAEYWVINSIDWLLSEGLVPGGGTVGVVHLEGESGDAVLAGAEAAAEAAGVTLVPQQVAASATDMSGVVTAFRNAGVEAIILNSTPTMTASVAGAAEAAGLTVPMVTVNGGGFNPGLLDTPVAGYLEENLYMALPWQMDDSDETVAKLISTFREEFPNDSFNENTMWGFGAAAAFASVLQSACENEDLTRAGVMKAFQETEEVDSLGLLVPLDYTNAGETPSRSIFIHEVDSAGLASEILLTEEPFLGESAPGFELG